MNNQEQIDALLAANNKLLDEVDKKQAELLAANDMLLEQVHKKQARIELLIQTTNSLTKELVAALDEISELEKWQRWHSQKCTCLHGNK
jgi:enoyl-CoA hydratase/carnithine racemase